MYVKLPGGGWGKKNAKESKSDDTTMSRTKSIERMGKPKEVKKSRTRVPREPPRHLGRLAAHQGCSGEELGALCRAAAMQCPKSKSL